MTQLTGTAGRTASHTPGGFVAGTLLTAAVMATGIILALALGLEGPSSAPRAGVSTYDGRLDPIERDYIRQVPFAPRAGVSTYDGRLDPIESDYIRQFGARLSSLDPERSTPGTSHGGTTRYQLVPR